MRQVYPAEIFVRRKKYNTPVFQSRHPALNEYISGAVQAISDELVLASPFALLTITKFQPITPQGNVDKVVVVIKNKEEVALERFIFSVQNMVQVEAYNKETG